jgi:hypothetical protein
MFKGFVTAFLTWSSVASFAVMFGFLLSQGREAQYNEYKAPVVEEVPAKAEPRPVYPPMKKKPYTRSTRMA